MWCWRRLLRVPWTARRSNQSILKEINPEYSLERLMLKLKVILVSWCKKLTHWKRPCCWERLRAGGAGGSRRWDCWKVSLTQWTWVWSHSEIVKDRKALLAIVAKSWTWLSDWTTTNLPIMLEIGSSQPCLCPRSQPSFRELILTTATSSAPAKCGLLPQSYRCKVLHQDNRMKPRSKLTYRSDWDPL